MRIPTWSRSTRLKRSSRRPCRITSIAWNRPCDRAASRRVGDIALPNQVPNVAANLRFFVNQETADTASCTAVYAHASGTWTMRSRYVQFSTCYHDESVSFTSNCEVASVFPRRPRVRGNRITQVKNPAQLYAVHRWITREPSQTQKKTLPLIDQFNGDVAAYQRWLLIDELKDAAEAGYLYLSESQHAYRATLRGAFLMTWKLLPPFKQIQLLKRKRKADRILAEMRRDANQSS